jgi:hypothetical protein
MAIRDNPSLDVRMTNLAIETLLKTTTNPRHRFLLEAYHRHRFLEIAGRYEEIFAPEMTCDHPVYHFFVGGYNATLTGTEAVKEFYAAWTQSHQSIFYSENEQVAVADNFIASVVDQYQQSLGSQLIANGIEVDDDQAYYLVKYPGMQMIWPYDERGRLMGEDVWEPFPEMREISKLSPEEVLTTEQSGELLAPYIIPMPSFEEVMRPSA